MKRALFLVLTIFLFAGSCETEEIVPISEIVDLQKLTGSVGMSYEESLSKWKELKNEHGDHYIYQTAFESFAGFGNRTQVEVKNGKVISRKFEEYRLSNPSVTEELIESYCESVEEIGTNNKGNAPLTMDELYEACATEYLTVDESQNDLFFQTTENGLMTICGYVPKFCADDCFIGIRIDAFDWVD